MKKSRSRIGLPLAILFLSLVIFFAGRVFNAANRLLNDVDAIQSIAQTSGTSSERFGSLEALFKQTARDYRDVRGGLGPTIYLAPLFGWLPRYGGNLENAPALFDLGDQIVTGAENALPLLSALDSTKGDAQLPTVAFLKVVSEQKNALEQSRQDYQQASRARKRINASKLSPSMQRMIERVDQFLFMWQAALDAGSIAPGQLGEDRPRIYLLLAQNSDELRPTGGFISSVALVRVNRGDIAVTDFMDSYAVDDMTRFHPQPPSALLKYMLAGLFVFRDTNWYPDFPTTARAAQNIYRVDRGIATDGVIAINLNGIPRLIDVLGTVTIEPGGEQVDASNVMAKMRTNWSPPAGTGPTPEWWSHRKDFMGQLLDAVMKRIKSGDFSRVRLASALAESIESKDLLIYMKDVDDSKQTNFLWSGALAGNSGDVLMVVDSNVGFNKVDANIDRRADYSATLDDNGGIRAVVTMVYTNLSAPDGKPCLHRAYYPSTYAELQQGCYWDYVRVIAPMSSQLLKTDGVLDPVTEQILNDRTVFGGYFVLGRGETRTIRFEYTVPQNSNLKSQYSLIWEKQPGAPSFPAQFHLVLPSGFIIRSADPTVNSQAGTTINFSLTLDRDRKIFIQADTLLGSSSTWLVLGIGVLIVGGSLIFRRGKQRLRQDHAKSD